MGTRPQVVVVGAGIGGLVLALELERVGLPCTVLEAAPELIELGVGINLLPHATRILARLGLEEALAAVAVTTKESAFFNRFGQHVYSEPAGRYAGNETPQFSIHRADLQQVLLTAVRDRLGADAVRLDHRAVEYTGDDTQASVHVVHSDGSRSIVSGDIVVSAEGVHSVLRKQLHPVAATPHYTGYTMWRGVTVAPPFLSGASMVRAGWLANGKMVIYPIRDNVDGKGNQLINWVAELEAPQPDERDWNRTGNIEDFIGPFADWTFDWLDVPELIRTASQILEYPMIDQDPLPYWTSGRMTLLGDAAHPMVPRGSNGSAQAIVDAQVLASLLSEAGDDHPGALLRYDELRREATSRVVLTNRTNPPDALLGEVYERTGDQPFDSIGEVISDEEIVQMMNRYRRITDSAPRPGDPPRGSDTVSEQR